MNERADNLDNNNGASNKNNNYNIEIDINIYTSNELLFNIPH